MKNRVSYKLPKFYPILGGGALTGTLVFGLSELITRTADQWIGIAGFILVFGALSTSLILAGQLYRIELVSIRKAKKWGSRTVGLEISIISGLNLSG